MKEHPLIQLVRDYLANPQNEITIHPVNEKGDIPITQIINFGPEVSQHESVLRFQNLTMSITYRSGLKTGMKSSVKKFIPLKGNSGNNTNIPVTRQLVSSSPDNDINS